MGLSNIVILHVFSQLYRHCSSQGSDKSHQCKIQIFRSVVASKPRLRVCYIMGIRDVIWVCQCHVLAVGFRRDDRIIATTGQRHHGNVFSWNYDRTADNGVLGRHCRTNQFVHPVYHWHRPNLFLHLDVRNFVRGNDLLRYYPWYRSQQTDS